jgi:hypothetical protein
MKTWIIIALIITAQWATAQTRQEWLQQKKTQREYLIKQIAALQVYLGYVKQGYQVASKGLGTINDIRHGEFNLHDGYFQSVKNINPKILNMAKVTAIIDLQLKISKNARDCMTTIGDLNQLTGAELGQCKLTFSNLLTDCIEDMNELVILTTNQQSTLKDDERISRINQIYDDMQDKYACCSGYSEEMILLTVQRVREASDIQVSKKINSIR